MKVVIQRITECKLEVDNKLIFNTNSGLLVLFGIGKDSKITDSEKLINKIINMRLFSLENKFDLSLKDIAGDLILIPQFTLYAETNQGRRPSFFDAMPPEEAKKFFEEVTLITKKIYQKSYFGIFGADMQLTFTNSGPVTICI